MEKMKLMCTHSEFQHKFHRGICNWSSSRYNRAFPNLRNFPPLNLVFYADADHVILRGFEMDDIY